jgi:hypothetical protein
MGVVGAGASAGGAVVVPQPQAFAKPNNRIVLTRARFVLMLTTRIEPVNVTKIRISDIGFYRLKSF